MKRERKRSAGWGKQKRLRKQSFHRIFIRYFLWISICTAALFCIAAYLGMELYAKQYQLERNETLQRFNTRFSELAGNPEDAFNPEEWIRNLGEDAFDLEKWRTDLGVQMIQEQNLTKITSFLYRMYDGAEIDATTNRPYMIAQSYGDAESSYCYMAGMDYSELIGMIEANQEKCRYEEGMSSDVRVEGIYIKGSKFYFGNVFLTISKNGKIISTQEYDGIPIWGFIEDYQFEDYIYIPAESMHLDGPYYADARILEKNRNYLEQHYNVSEKILSGELGGYDSIVDSHLFQDSYVITCSPINPLQHVVTGFCMVSVYHYNLWQKCGLVVKGAAVITFLLSLLFTFFFSYRRYMLQKLQWEMLSYRKNLINIMAHDLRTPLTAISGYAENIMHDSDPKKNGNYLQSIVDNVQYMKELIQHVLLLSGEVDEQQPHTEPVELADMTEELLRRYAKQAEEKNINVHQSGRCQLSVNATWFHSVLKNLIGNAIEHGKEGSMVRISMDRDSYTIVNAIQPESNGQNRMKGIGMSIIKEILGYYGYQMEVSQKDDMFMVRLLFKGKTYGATSAK